MRSRVPQFALAALLAATAAAGASAQPGPAVVQHIAVVPSKRGLSVQITTSRSVVPRLTRLENPIRVVIDLPGALLPGGLRHIPVQEQDITEVRASQWKESPPIARVVVQLRTAREFSVITAANKMTLWLLPGTAQAARQTPPRMAATAAPATPAPAAPAPATNPAPAAPAYQSAASAQPLANFETLHGAESVSATENPTVLQLPRGGEIHVCPGTTVSVTPSKSGRDLMVGLSTGAIETHYTLGPAADVILTPDFRILLPGPGEFHLAVSADRHGNTCVRTLPGNTAAAVVSEIMDNETFQVNASDQVLFRGGQLRNVSSAADVNCGCPLRTVPVMRTDAQPLAVPPSAWLSPAPSGLPAGQTKGATDPVGVPARTPVQVEAPFVFRAVQATTPNPWQVAQLRFSNGPPPELLRLQVTGPARVTYYKLDHSKMRGNKPRGFFSRLRGFFGGMFR